MKKYILILLLFTGFLQAQTLQNPTFGNTTTNTLKVKTNTEASTSTKLSTQETDGSINFIQPINVPIPYTPANYSISNQSIGQHIAGIDTRLGQISSTTAGITQRVYFTADNITVTAGTFFASSTTGKGSTATGSPPALVLADNTKGYFTKDIISVAFPAATIGYAGSYTGQLTVSATPTPVATQQRFTVEIYRTNNGGTPIASGVSGAPTGDLGVTVVAILDSGILNLTAGSITNIPITGILTQNITLNTGERLRYHVSAAKIGAGGGSVTFGVYYGSSYNSYYDVPVAITTDAVLNKSSVTGVTATDALNGLAKKAGDTFTGDVYAPNYNTVNIKSSTPITGGALNARMCVSNGMLYVTEYTNNKVGVFSLENPMAPSKIYDFGTGLSPRHVVVNGRNLFVACHDSNKIEIFDIQNPESAFKIGEILTGANPKMFQLLGNEIFVVCAGTSKVEKYKITMPDASLSNFSYYKVGEVSVGTTPLAIAYNGDGLLAVCGNGSNLITVLSTDDLHVASSAAFGGAGHGTCAWFNKTQLLVTDWTTDSLLSIDYNNLSTPVLSSSITVSENPEQIEIVGNKAYIPSLRAGLTPSYLDFIDLQNAKQPVKIKSELLTVNAAGFTAPYTDGVHTYLYVDGHEAPFNIDAIKIDNGEFHRHENTMLDIKYVNRFGVANLSTNTIDESKKYTNTTNPYTISGVDNVLRLTSGTTTLPNPNSVRDGKIITLSNTSNAGNVTVTNPFSGVPSLVLYPYESITIQAAKSGVSYAWDVIGGRRNFPNIFESSNGNIGIGTITPSSFLANRYVSINGTDGSVLQLRKNNITFAEIGGDGTFINFDTFGSAYSKFSILGVEKLRIESAKITAVVPVVVPNATNTNEAINLGQLNAAIPSGIKRYKALISQSGTSAPTVIVLENSLSSTPVWTRNATGSYYGTVSGGFNNNKTIAFISGSMQNDWTFGISTTNAGANVIWVQTRSAGVPADTMLDKTSILIEEYP